jgi:hypothetical protein
MDKIYKLGINDSLVSCSVIQLMVIKNAIANVTEISGLKLLAKINANIINLITGLLNIFLTNFGRFGFRQALYTINNNTIK